ncbi:MAG: heme NO-binding domain-containing protein [Magnetococcales bacterium]|nr:heme NO-binding domain-containing protein [Magnetococcales bacterium]
MHGILFLALEDFIESRLGEGVWETALEAAKLEQFEFEPDRYYADTMANVLFAITTKFMKFPLSKTLELFGEHMAPGLVTMGRSMGMIQKDWKTLDIIERLQSDILPPFANREAGVKPPDIRTYRLKHSEVAVAYVSHRKLCALMKGIIRGLGKFFQEPIAFKEYVCMQQNAPLCRLSVFLDDPFLVRYVDIEREFGLIHSQIIEISFYNSFQGVPYTSIGLVMQYSKEDVVIQASPSQLIAMQEEQVTYIAVPHLQQGLKALIQKVDVAQGVATLGNIRLTDGSVGSRRFPRVGPDKRIAVKMQLSRRALRGHLLNLSRGGARILLEKDSRMPEVLLYEPVSLEFSLPLKFVEMDDVILLGPLQMNLDGNVLDASPVDGCVAVRIVFGAIDGQERVILEQYSRKVHEDVKEIMTQRLSK